MPRGRKQGSSWAMRNPRLHQRRIHDPKGWEELVLRAIRESTSWHDAGRRLGVSHATAYNWYHYQIRAHRPVYSLAYDVPFATRTPEQRAEERADRPKTYIRNGRAEKIRAVAIAYEVSTRTVQGWIRNGWFDLERDVIVYQPAPDPPDPK